MGTKLRRGYAMVVQWLAVDRKRRIRVGEKITLEPGGPEIRPVTLKALLKRDAVSPDGAEEARASELGIISADLYCLTRAGYDLASEVPLVILKDEASSIRPDRPKKRDPLAWKR